jgi:hypothetical protein
MPSRRRTIIMVITSLVAAGSLLYVQRRFDVGDEHNALALVHGYRSDAGVSIPELLQHRHPGKAVAWSTHTESSCFQHVRVEAEVSEQPPRTYAFSVDINGPSIHPANEAGKELLGGLEQPLPPGSAAPPGGSQP